MTNRDRSESEAAALKYYDVRKRVDAAQRELEEALEELDKNSNPTSMPVGLLFAAIEEMDEKDELMRWIVQRMRVEHVPDRRMVVIDLADPFERTLEFKLDKAPDKDGYVQAEVVPWW